MQTKPVVLSYDQYLYEKKINQQLAQGAPEKGKTVSKQVDPKTSKIPVTNKKASSKTVNPELSDIPKKKGSVPTKSVKPDTSTIPSKKGSVPTKSVSTQTTSKLVIKGKPLSKQVKPEMADLPYGAKVVDNQAVKKVSSYKK